MNSCIRKLIYYINISNFKSTFSNNILGPAHKKSFTVCLKLGDVEEYVASGPSIKKAQHAAAAIALEKTSLKHPPPKTKATKSGISLPIK